MPTGRVRLLAVLLATAAVSRAGVAEVPAFPNLEAAAVPPSPPADLPLSAGQRRLIGLTAVPAATPPAPWVDPTPPVASAGGPPGPPGPGTAPPPSEHRRVALLTSWMDGLRFDSPDHGFKLHVGGSAQIDSTWLIGPDSAFALPNDGGTSGIGGAAGTFLRRARLRVEGEIHDQYDFIVEYDFANANNENSGLQPPSFSNLAGQPVPTNIWMQVRDVPYLQKVRFGLLQKPIGMSKNTSHNNLPFLERPDNSDAFYGPFDNGRALGLVSRNVSAGERLTWQYGIFRPMTNTFGVSLNKGEWGGRVTGLPVYEDDGRVLVHLGLGTLNGELPENRLRVRARPVLRNGPGFAVPVLVDTGQVPGSRQYTLAPEFAAVLGPWTVQAEWTGQFLTRAKPAGRPDQGTVFYQGGYAEVLYFLTGEHQPYVRSEGVFGRVVPNRNLKVTRGEGLSGCGAWQVGLRFSYLDLNDKAVRGGTVYDWTAGVNWFWNPNMKVQLNAILERRDQPGVDPAWISGVGVRGSYDF